MTKGSERNYCLKILEDMEEKGLFASQVLDDYFYVYDFDKQQRSFISKLIYGILEQQIYIDYALNQVSKVKVKKMKPVIRHLMRMAAYQILFMDKVPDHAAINESVKLTKKRKFHQLSGFVNGVLRSLVREKDKIDSKIDKLADSKRLSIRYSVAEDLVNKLLDQYGPFVTEEFLGQSLKEKPTVIRLNLGKASGQEVMDGLGEGVHVEQSPLLKSSLHISGYDQLSKVKAFQQGHFQVQDESSTLVGFVSGIEEGMRVLDTCAAPGGKSTHAAELLAGSGQVIACDISPTKLLKIEENVSRLGLDNVVLNLQDASEMNEDYVESFDIVLCDAPCSGLGILRNKPDIKMNISLDDMDQLVNLQRNILDNVKSYVKPGGLLIYSTCTVNKEENLYQVKRFLKKNQDFVLEPIDEVLKTYADQINVELLEPFISEGCLQLLTNEGISDGFFISRLRKK